MKFFRTKSVPSPLFWKNKLAKRPSARSNPGFIYFSIPLFTLHPFVFRPSGDDTSIFNDQAYICDPLAFRLAYRIVVIRLARFEKLRFKKP